MIVSRRKMKENKNVTVYLNNIERKQEHKSLLKQQTTGPSYENEIPWNNTGSQV
jgi:hypothetical protein